MNMPPDDHENGSTIHHGPEPVDMTLPSSNSDANLTEGSYRSWLSRFYHTFDEHPKDPNPNANQLHFALNQSLKSYHSQLIALGSAIGTGLFIASGEGLSNAGPIPLLLAFCFIGVTLCPTVFALGEMATLFPLPGGFFEHCRMYTDEAWGAAMGWNYVLQWLITLPLELVASSITLQYWGNPLRKNASWVTMFLFLIVVINVMGVKIFADFEAALSILKVSTIVGFIIFGLLRDVGLGFGGQPIGFTHWYRPGAAHNGWYGFCSVLVIAAFAYSGSEVVGLTAAEQEDPKRDMPRAIRKVFWRIGLFYIASIFLVGLLVPYDNPQLINSQQSFDSKASPFVIALTDSGKQVLPAFFNSIILITVLSVANSSVYGSSRVLGAMAKAGLAPKAFSFIDTKGRPIRCFYLSLAFGFLAYLGDLHKENTVFLWLVSLCGLSSIVSWTSICATHICFRRALKIHGKALESLPYQSPMGVIGSWIGLLCNMFIIVSQLVTAIRPVGYKEMSGQQKVVSFFQSFMAVPLVLTVWFGFKFFKGTKIQGITFSWSGIKISKPRIIRGRGTTAVNLRKDLSFEGSWNRGAYQRYARLNPHKVILVEELWWCPRPLRPYIKFFYFPWERLPKSTPDEETAIGETITSHENLLQAMCDSPRAVFGYIQRLRYEKETFLRGQFGMEGSIDSYLNSLDELIAEVGCSTESADDVLEHIQRLRAERDALLQLSYFGESEPYYTPLSDGESENLT